MADSRFILNPPRPDDLAVFDRVHLEAESALQCHRALPGYAATPLHRLTSLARQLRIDQLWIKDESSRLGLDAFKVLGASYAVHRALSQSGNLARQTDVAFATATDGNHGRAVAWAARKAGCPAIVFMPGGSALPRIRAIEREGATVHVVDGAYDAAVAQAAREARRHGWTLIQDTAWPGYEQVPLWIMAGYVTVLGEIESVLFPEDGPAVDCVLLQAGVGSWAAAATWYLRKRYGRHCPKIVCVEPLAADCLLQSARQGRLAPSTGDGRTIMAGLNCGTPSTIAWTLLHAGIDAFVAISDEWARTAMRVLYRPADQDVSILAGESGAAGLAGLLAIMQDHALADLRSYLELNGRSRVLLFNTEGVTDPDSFARIIGPVETE